MADPPHAVPSPPIRIVLADDHTMIRTGLRMLLDAEPDLAVVAEAADVDAALHAAVTEQPDVVVLDLTMPGRPTLAAIPEFREHASETAVVVLTMNDDPAFARQALHLGVRAYVLKESAESELVEAVRAAAGGSTYLNPRLGASLVAPRSPAREPARDARTEDGQLYVTMRYVDGTDLRALLSRERRLSASRVASILAQVADGLDEAHRLGLVHRDVKPANILLATAGGQERACVADFGLLRHREEGSGLTATGFAIGTPDYMAPEQARGDPVDARTDIYALGCVAFRALTGRVPFERATDLDKLWAHVNDAPPRLLEACPELPARVGAVIDRALAKDPADRQATAADFGRDLLATAESPAAST